MTARRRRAGDMGVLAISYLALGVVGAVHSVRQGRTARFAAVTLPGTPAQHALTVGTPLSAPPVTYAALLALTLRRDPTETQRAAVRRLAILFLVGIAGELDTWSTLRRPAADPLSTACVVGDVVLPLALMRAAHTNE